MGEYGRIDNEWADGLYDDDGLYEQVFVYLISFAANRDTFPFLSFLFFFFFFFFITDWFFVIELIIRVYQLKYFPPTYSSLSSYLSFFFSSSSFIFFFRIFMCEKFILVDIVV